MVLLTLVAAAFMQNPTTLRVGSVITRSCVILPKEYALPTAQGATKAGDEEIPALTPAIRIKGDNIAVDFAGATLRGTSTTTDPDKRKGLGIEVEGNNVTLKNLHVHGYKVGLWAKNCRGLKIANADFSYNWKQRLMSTVDQEDESDWQSYHHNEHNEWLRYGAAIYLEGCENFRVTVSKTHGGQCGLMLVRSNNGLIADNDFSFMSGLGLGMYRSSRNRVLNNHIDWCVRGFSYGVYNRGQDSAGILVFEQCNDNLFAYNSVTHGGDGFFLWAGQQTMDTGKGGCNGNVLFGNDFSNSPCNGIEATFSTNTFANNKLLECWHGVWGGYSYNTQIIGNTFGYNGEAIAIEHGQNNAINHNLFYRDNAGVDLWQDPADPNSPYAKNHDTGSHDYQIFGDAFDGITTTAIAIRNTGRAFIGSNSFEHCGAAFKEAGNNPDLTMNASYTGDRHAPPPTINAAGQPTPGTSDDLAEYLKRFDIAWDPSAAEKPRTLSAPMNDAYERAKGCGIAIAPVGAMPFLKKGSLRGQRYILVDEWGPYDFHSPVLWPRQFVKSDEIRRFEILGPQGTWRLASSQGIAGISAKSGPVPGFVDVQFPKTGATQVKIDLVYTGGPTVDYRGIETPKGKPVHFGYSVFNTSIDWDVRFYKWDSSNDPRDQSREFKGLVLGKMVKEVHTNKLNYKGGTFVPEAGADHFLTLCAGKFKVPAGSYTLELTTDDGARVWVDDKLVIGNAWKYQGPTLYTADLKLDGSQHTIRVNHFQIDGYAELKVDLKPKMR